MFMCGIAYLYVFRQEVVVLVLNNVNRMNKERLAYVYTRVRLVEKTIKPTQPERGKNRDGMYTTCVFFVEDTNVNLSGY
jgi:hypothetical protein